MSAGAGATWHGGKEGGREGRANMTCMGSSRAV